MNGALARASNDTAFEPNQSDRRSGIVRAVVPFMRGREELQADSEVHSEEVAGAPRAPLSLRLTSRGMIIGTHPSIRRILETIDRVARSMCTVLVTGESGTGKELAVAALHDASARAAGPLVTINCGAIPLELLESELFGHVKGAFTGAQSNRRGHIASAEGGTLFLDEVGELPASAQVKLLRVLQQREYTPVGESRAIKCDVRIVAATNRDLAADVVAGRFREDLYYRLNVIHLALPALRERGDDVRILAEHFYRGFVATCERGDLKGPSEGALAAICAYPWPGNVRELENAIERGVLLARGPYLEPENVFGTPPPPAGPARNAEPPPPLGAPQSQDLTFFVPPKPRPFNDSVPAEDSQKIETLPITSFPNALPEEGIDLYSCVESYQNNLIVQALRRTAGNKNKAAQLLGLNRTTLVEMIRRRGI